MSASSQKRWTPPKVELPLALMQKIRAIVLRHYKADAEKTGWVRTSSVEVAALLGLKGPAAALVAVGIEDLCMAFGGGPDHEEIGAGDTVEVGYDLMGENPTHVLVAPSRAARSR